MNTKIEHGGNIYKVAESLGCQPEEIIDFSSNMNPSKPASKLDINRAMFEAYADPEYHKLKETIALKYELKHEEIKLFNGASSAIIALFEQLDYDNVALYAPLYGEYKVAAQRQGKKIQLINRMDDIWKKPEQGSLVVFVNPSTPDGKSYDFDALLREWQALECTVIMDESFLEFTQIKSLRSDINSYTNLYIIQSFTKFYACAGLRIGAVFSHESNIDKLFTPMWPLSSIDVNILGELLTDTAHQENSTNNFPYYLQRLRSILCHALVFDDVYQSEANYILTRSSQAKAIEEKLLKHKIMVRNCGNFDFLDERYLRFAVKDDKALDALEKAFKDECE